MPLLPKEKPCSILVTPLEGGTSPEYIVVGTAMVDIGDDEPNTGRLLVLRVHLRRLVLVQALDVSGMAYTMASFRGGVLVGITSSVLFFGSSASAEVEGDPALKFRLPNSSCYFFFLRRNLLVLLLIKASATMDRSWY